MFPAGALRTARLAALLSLSIATAATGQTRPLLTEPAITAPHGTLVLETGFDAIAGQQSYRTGSERTLWEGPLLRLVGSPSDNVEFDLEWTTRVGVLGEPGRGAIQSSDWGDVTLRAKWRILDGGGSRATWGVRFGAVLPQTSYEDKQFRPLGLGPNTLRAFVEALLTRPVGRLRVHANAGLFLFDEVRRPHDQRDFFSYGAAAEWSLDAGASAFAEVAGRAGRGTPGAEAHGEARAGLSLGRPRLRFDVALRRGTGAGDGSWGVTAGLTWRLRPKGGTAAAHGAPLPAAVHG